MHKVIGLFFETDFSISQYLEISVAGIRAALTASKYIMAERGISKAKAEVAKSQLYLQFGVMNNFNTWRLHQIDRCSIEFGFQANVLRNNVQYVPPGVVASDYTPEVVEGEPALTAASLVTLRLEAEKQRNKEIHMLKLSMPKFLIDALGIAVHRVQGGSITTYWILGGGYESRSEHALDNNQRDPSHGDSWCRTWTVGDCADEKQVQSAETETWHIYWRVQERVRRAV